MNLLQTERTTHAKPSARLGHETPDVVSSSDVYADRFSGAVGQFFLQEQTEIVDDLLQDCGKRVLDVGGGHAQLAVPLASRGYDVTVLGSSLACRRQLDKSMSSHEYSFTVGSLLNLPFADHSFDAVLGFRLMAHVTAWPLLIQELCRVSRGSVVIDYSEQTSINVLSQMLFPIKLAIEGSTRHYRCHGQDEIERCFGESAFRVVAARRQFLLPMALHRGLRCAPLSRVSERFARRLGATQRWGSPAIVMAQRVVGESAVRKTNDDRTRASVIHR